MKYCLLQAAVVSILLYGCIALTLTKRMEKKLNGNYTRMLRAILNKSSRQHSTKQLLYGHLPPITKTIKIRWTRHTGHCWRSRDELISDVPLHIDEQKQDDQLEPTHSSSVPIRDVVLKTCRKQWTIGRGGERGLGVSIAWHDNDDLLKRSFGSPSTMHVYTCVYIYIYIYMNLLSSFLETSPHLLVLNWTVIKEHYYLVSSFKKIPFPIFSFLWVLLAKKFFPELL